MKQTVEGDSGCFLTASFEKSSARRKPEMKILQTRCQWMAEATGNLRRPAGD